MTDEYDGFTGEHDKQAGAVSIFLVVFFALLLGVITIGFINIVIRDSRQAVNSDLSQSAFDSAQAGVEDTKRALALYAKACAGGESACTSYADRLNSNDCDTLADETFRAPLGLRTPSGAERNKSVTVQNTDNDTLDQAYTCVKVQLNTPDYIGSKPAYTSEIVPLTSTSAFDSVSLNWFTHADAGIKDGEAFTLPGNASDLPQAASWPTTTPSILRVELISYGATFSGDSLSDDMRTLFLYPGGSAIGQTSFDLDAAHRTGGKAAPIAPAACKKATTDRYACSMKIDLGGLGTSAGKTMLLRVTPIYGAKTTFRVSLGSSGGTDPLFAGVQPSVDSTGRAGDLFRRVEARLRTTTSVLYPEFAVDVNNSLCKNFSVGATDGDFIPGTCN